MGPVDVSSISLYWARILFHLLNVQDLNTLNNNAACHCMMASHVGAEADSYFIGWIISHDPITARNYGNFWHRSFLAVNP